MQIDGFGSQQALVRLRMMVMATPGAAERILGAIQHCAGFRLVQASSWLMPA
jgi:hypothetical protein